MSKSVSLSSTWQHIKINPDLENVGSIAGACGATMLAMNNSVSAYGWLMFLGSNICFILFCARKQLYSMLAMNIVFLATSLLGIYRWIL